MAKIQTVIDLELCPVAAAGGSTGAASRWASAEAWEVTKGTCSVATCQRPRWSRQRRC
jgi:hypothetical protein